MLNKYLSVCFALLYSWAQSHVYNYTYLIGKFILEGLDKDTVFSVFLKFAEHTSPHLNERKKELQATQYSLKDLSPKFF